MQRVVICLLVALVSGGCAATRPPTFAVDGYQRIPIPVGCYGGKGEHNVELAPELYSQLIGLLRDPPNDATCWHMRRDGTLLVTIGPGCGLHREAEFQKLSGAWILTVERNNITSECFIQCDKGSGKYCAV